MPGPETTNDGVGRALIVALAAAAAVAGLIAFANSQRETSLDRSAIGLDGLVTWLASNGVEARSFRGGDQLTRERVGLRVYPLYDVDLLQPASLPATAEERLLSTGQRDVDLPVLAVKIAWLPTLVVLPKWRGGVIDLAAVHPDLLIPETEVERVLRQVAPDAGAPLPRPEGFSMIPAPSGLEAQLYGAQLVRPGACTPIIGSGDAMLLGRCSHKKDEFWLLTDPDLLDNHGLTRGDNARIALNMLPEIADGRPVLLDLTTTGAFDRNKVKERVRTWADLLRFFAPPFTGGWAALALVLALVLWRAWIRTGPIENLGEDQIEAAREVSIDAKARLLRLSRHDAPLVDTYIGGRVLSLAADLFGPLRVGNDAFEQIRRLLARRAPALAEAFTKVSRDHGGRTSEAELLQRLEDFEQIEGRILDEFGRSPFSRASHPR